MELLRGLGGLRGRHRPCVATIGAFDGVHRGHRVVIEQLAQQSARCGLPSTLVTFEPLPREYLAREHLAPRQAPARLQSFRERYEALRALGVKRLLCLRFDEALRQMSAEHFARAVFVQGLGVRSLVLGDDFRFGRAREGDAALMREVGAREGFATLGTRTIEHAGERISSSRVRGALRAGDFALAQALLGRPYTLSGRVTHGRRLGREIGFPTANIALRRLTLPLAGVYAVAVRGAALAECEAIANVGRRPSVAEGLRPNLEVHLLAGNPDLYGQRLQVRFLRKLREEHKFASIDALKTRIRHDVQHAREWFAGRAKDHRR